MGHDHSHHPGVGEGGAVDRRRLTAALSVLAAFLVAEAVTGLLISSLALLSDAAHLLTDVAALALAVITSRLVERPARGVFTYGFTRLDALSGQANGITLLVLAVWLGVSAVRRLIDPHPVAGLAVTLVAVVGVAVNLVVTLMVSRADRSSLNVAGAFAHLLNDLWAFGATAAAGLVIVFTGWDRADAVASLIIAALMIVSGTGLVRRSARVFLEAAPVGMQPEEIGTAMAQIAGVAEVHDLHLWDLGSGEPALSAHLVVRSTFDCHLVASDVRRLLREDYHVGHATLQADHQHGPLSVADSEPCVDNHGPGYAPVGPAPAGTVPSSE